MSEKRDVSILLLAALKDGLRCFKDMQKFIFKIIIVILEQFI